MVEPISFKEQWEAKKVLKRAKKKAKKSLQHQGLGRKEAAKAVNTALNRIANKPEKRAAGRGN